jgi:hypothetical protein
MVLVHSESAHVNSHSLLFFRFRKEITFPASSSPSAAPSWWSQTQTTLRTILNKVLNFESEDDTSIDSDIPLGQCRSAGLLASLQIETLQFIFQLCSNQFEIFSSSPSPSDTNTHITPLRSNSSISPLTTSEDPSSSSQLSHHLLLSERNLSTSIICYPLLLTSQKCLSRLIEHRDRHIQSSSFVVLTLTIKLLTKVLNFLDFNRNNHPVPPHTHLDLIVHTADWNNFQLFLRQSLEEVIVPSLVELLQKEIMKGARIDSYALWMIIDPLLCLASPDVITKKIQVLSID